MAFCDFLGERHKRVEFLAPPPDPMRTHLLYFGMEHFPEKGRGVRFKDHLTCYLALEGRAEYFDGKETQGLKPGGGLLCPAFAEKDLHTVSSGCTWAWIGCSGNELGRHFQDQGLTAPFVFEDSVIQGSISSHMVAIADGLKFD